MATETAALPNPSRTALRSPCRNAPPAENSTGSAFSPLGMGAANRNPPRPPAQFLSATGGPGVRASSPQAAKMARAPRQREGEWPEAGAAGPVPGRLTPQYASSLPRGDKKAPLLGGKEETCPALRAVWRTRFLFVPRQRRGGVAPSFQVRAPHPLLLHSGNDKVLLLLPPLHRHRLGPARENRPILTPRSAPRANSLRPKVVTNTVLHENGSGSSSA